MSVNGGKNNVKKGNFKGKSDFSWWAQRRMGEPAERILAAGYLKKHCIQFPLKKAVMLIMKSFCMTHIKVGAVQPLWIVCVEEAFNPFSASTAGLAGGVMFSGCPSVPFLCSVTSQMKEFLQIWQKPLWLNYEQIRIWWSKVTATSRNTFYRS